MNINFKVMTQPGIKPEFTALATRMFKLITKLVSRFKLYVVDETTMKNLKRALENNFCEQL